jgi:hypothetical protein
MISLLLGSADAHMNYWNSVESSGFCRSYTNQNVIRQTSFNADTFMPNFIQTPFVVSDMIHVDGQFLLERSEHTGSELFGYSGL